MSIQRKGDERSSSMKKMERGQYRLRGDTSVAHGDELYIKL